MLPGALLRRVGEAYCAGRVGAGTVELRSSMRGERRLGAMGDGESRAKPSAPRKDGNSLSYLRFTTETTLWVHARIL